MTQLYGTGCDNCAMENHEQFNRQRSRAGPPSAVPPDACRGRRLWPVLAYDAGLNSAPIEIR